MYGRKTANILLSVFYFSAHYRWYVEKGGDANDQSGSC